MFEYRALVTSVHDGDTVRADVDLGCDVHINLTLRLAGIDAPELSTLAGHQAKDWLVAYLARTANLVTLHTVKDRTEKYGRYLAVIFLGQPGYSGESANDAMIAAGHAVAYDGGKRAP